MTVAVYITLVRFSLKLLSSLTMKLINELVLRLVVYLPTVILCL